MGLAGRKVKQRIPADPRNLSWADDASRFGQSYLSKFGWDATQGVGLGASGDGMKSHLKVSQKLDMLGIGAAHKKDPHGIAWKQNKDFEALLQRLNEGKEEKDSAVEQGGFVSATKGKAKEDGTDGEDVTIPRDKKQKRKRKHHDEGDGSRERDKKRKKKQKVETQGTSEGGATEGKPLNVVDDDTPQNDDVPTPSSIKATETNDFRPKPKGRPMAHRARFQAAKRLATKSTAAIAEILGIAPSSSTPPSSLATPKRSSSTPEPSSTAPEDTQPSLEKLTTSTKSLADYFKDKLAAKKSTVATPIPPDADDDYDPPRSGLCVSRTSLPSSAADEAPQRIGLGFTLTVTPTALESTSSAQGTQAIPASGPLVQNGGNQENHNKNKRKGSKSSQILETGFKGETQRQGLQAQLEASNKEAGHESIGINSGDAKIKKDSRHEDPATENLEDTSVKAKVRKKRKEAKGKVTGNDKSKRKSRKGSEEDTLAQ